MAALSGSTRKVLMLASLLALQGCEMASYYLQAIGGHMSIVNRAQPVDRLLADPATPETLRNRLAVSVRIRDFASRELKLPDNGSYRSYSDLERPYAVWNVVAAGEFDLAPVQSCFPVTGCVAYRGFYAKEAADRYAAGLRAAGNDVFTAGVPAYSTLGWFDDPLLSTFIRYADADLARLLFHELSHQVVFVKGDSTFNESFAVAVEREGVRRWLRAERKEAALQSFLEGQQRTRDFGRLLAGTRDRLRALYKEGIAPEAKRARKAEAFAQLKADYERLKRERWNGFAGYDRFMVREEPNNALLASFATYTEYVEGFEKLLAASGGDMAVFYERVKQLAAQSRDAREAQLTQR
jgi:predicted aminopeptidase